MHIPRDSTADAVPVLAVADVHDELTPLVESLTTVVAPIDVTTDEDRALQILDRPEPRILALAFSTLDLSLLFYLRALKRTDGRGDRWQTLLFCDRTEARRAFDLCREAVIDDYLVTRPLYDAWQLALAVKHARDRLALRQWVQDVTTHAPGHRSLEQCIADLETAASDEIPRNARLERALTEVRLAVTDLSGHLREGARLVEQARAAEVDLARLAATPASPSSSAPLPTPATILVIDDDTFSRSIVSRSLEFGGYRVAQAGDGIDGLATLHAQRVDLILMDIEMPRLAGIETTRRVREHWPADVLPVIMLTGHGEEGTVLDALAAGASDFLLKPATRADLLAKVAHHLAGVRSTPAGGDAP